MDESGQMACWTAAVDRDLTTQADDDRAAKVYGSLFSDKRD